MEFKIVTLSISVGEKIRAPGKQRRQTACNTWQASRIHASRLQNFIHLFTKFIFFCYLTLTSNVLNFEFHGRLYFALLRLPLHEHNELFTHVLINRDKGTRKLVRPHDY